MTNHAHEPYMELYFSDYDEPPRFTGAYGLPVDYDCKRLPCRSCGLPKDAHRLYRKGFCFPCVVKAELKMRKHS